MYICVQFENRTAYDMFNEDTFQDPTNVPRDVETFHNEELALEFYNNNRPYKFFGSAGMYWAYPIGPVDQAYVDDIRNQIKKYSTL